MAPEITSAVPAMVRVPPLSTVMVPPEIAVASSSVTRPVASTVMASLLVMLVPELSVSEPEMTLIGLIVGDLSPLASACRRDPSRPPLSMVTLAEVLEGVAAAAGVSGAVDGNAAARDRVGPGHLQHAADVEGGAACRSLSPVDCRPWSACRRYRP